MKRAAERPAAGSGHLLPFHRDRSLRQQHRVRTGHRPVPHRARGAARRALRLVGRYGRPGLGHRRRRHEDLFDDASCTSRTSSFIPATRSMPTIRSPTRSLLGRHHLEEPHRHRKSARWRDTLDEYRGQWKYNLLDDHVPRPERRCPTFYQWDDHEVLNNWSPSTDPARRPSLPGQGRLASCRARHAGLPGDDADRAFDPAQPGRIFRKIPYGRLLDVFFVDLRSYRGPTRAPEDQDGASRLLGGSADAG